MGDCLHFMGALVLGWLAVYFLVVKPGRKAKAVEVLRLNAIDMVNMSRAEVREYKKRKFDEARRLISHRILACLDGLHPSQANAPGVQKAKELLKAGKGQLGMGKGRVFIAYSEFVGPGLTGHDYEAELPGLPKELVRDLYDLLSVSPHIK